MVVDYERAWAELSRFTSSKTSHGQRDLAAEMVRIVGECTIEDEGLLERALRVYGVQVTEDLLSEIRSRKAPADVDPVGAHAMVSH